MARQKKPNLEASEGSHEASAVELRRRQGMAAFDEDLGVPDPDERRAAEVGISTDRDVDEQEITRISSRGGEASTNREPTRRRKSVEKK